LKLDFSQLGKFLLEKGISDQESLHNFGQLALSTLVIDPELNKIFDTLNQISLYNHFDIYQKFT
jgi:hypothetical protein